MRWLAAGFRRCKAAEEAPALNDPLPHKPVVTIDHGPEDVGIGFVQGPGLVLVAKAWTVLNHPMSQLVGHDIF